MSDGKKYLEMVTEKLEKRILEIRQSISEGQKEIEGMHEYYWENYTEMEQSTDMKTLITSRHFCIR